MERVKDMSLWLNYLAYDVMGEVVFGNGFDMMTDEKERYILPLIDNMVFSMLLVSLGRRNHRSECGVLTTCAGRHYSFVVQMGNHRLHVPVSLHRPDALHRRGRKENHLSTLPGRREQRGQERFLSLRETTIAGIMFPLLTIMI